MKGQEDRSLLAFLEHPAYLKKKKKKRGGGREREDKTHPWACTVQLTAILMSLMRADGMEVAGTRSAQEKE